MTIPQWECMRPRMMMEPVTIIEEPYQEIMSRWLIKYWRIIRVNGDGTLRLIYDGTSGHANGESSSNRQVTTRSFNSWYTDNAYEGYMYGDPSDNQISEATVAFTYTGLNSTSKYYFGTSYTFDKSTNNFTLSGDLVQATLSEYRDKI